jgi:regulator of sigma E protease
MSSIGNLAITIVEFVISLGILAFLHELGHFLVSRLFKIEVEEFGFGFPPRLAHLFTLGGTEFTLNWIPFGAFVRPKGENDPTIPGGMAAANPWKRLAVVFGGPVMNLLAGIIIFSLVFVKVGAPDPTIVQIVGVSPNSPAAQAGFQNGDVVVAVNGVKVTDTQNLSDMVRKSLGKPVSLSVKRNNQQIELQATPRVNPPQGEGALGVLLGNPVRRINWFESIPFATQMTYEQIKQMALLPGRLIAGNIPPDQARVVGPVGMFDIYQQARQRDTQSQAAPNPQNPAVNTLLLMAFISVALGITNLLPIPALDGGRILFVLPELITHRRVKPEFENTVHMIGFALLILLLVVITTNDFLHPIALP